MPSKEDLKRLAFQAIDDRADEIVGLAQTILKNPEPGFRETKTSHLITSKFAELSIPFRGGMAITGVRGELTGGTAGPTLAILGELDSLIVSEHPHADAATGAAHACGHHCQIGMLYGAALGLMQSGVLSELSGRLVFMAVPAEEYIEIEYRDSLRREGKIEFLGGKPELEEDPVHRPWRPRRGHPSPGNQRAERGDAGIDRHSLQPGDLPRRRYGAGTPNHNQGRGSG